MEQEIEVSFSVTYSPSETNEANLRALAARIGGVSIEEYADVEPKDLIRYILDAQTLKMVGVGVVVQDSQAQVLSGDTPKLG